MIIGINGYIGSGKDTVGNIIAENLQYPEPCKQFSGNSWEIKKFAAKLKQIASLLTGIPIERFEDQEFKKTYLGPEWNWSGAISSDVPITVREFLQRLGTEAIRDNIHPDAWVNALFADYNPKVTYQGYVIDLADNAEEPEPIGKPVDAEYPNWIITDVRFPNEAQAIKEKEGIVIRVNRQEKEVIDLPGGRATFTLNAVDLHPSETSLDDWEFDWVIENNGSIEELIERVKQMLIYFKLL